MTEEQIRAEIKKAHDEGFREALSLVRCALKLSRMGMSECEIVKKLNIDAPLIHQLLEK